MGLERSPKSNIFTRYNCLLDNVMDFGIPVDHWQKGVRDSVCILKFNIFIYIKWKMNIVPKITFLLREENYQWLTWV
jgi:hypothetical protein